MGSSVYYAGIAEYVVRASKSYGRGSHGHGYHKNSSKGDRHFHRVSVAAKNSSSSYVPSAQTKNNSSSLSSLVNSGSPLSLDDTWRPPSSMSNSNSSPPPVILVASSSSHSSLGIPLTSSSMNSLHSGTGNGLNSHSFDSSYNHHSNNISQNLNSVSSPGLSSMAFELTSTVNSFGGYMEPRSSAYSRSSQSTTATSSYGAFPPSLPNMEEEMLLFSAKGSKQNASSSSSPFSSLCASFPFPGEYRDSDISLSCSTPSFYAVFRPSTLSSLPTVVLSMPFQTQGSSGGEVQCFRDDDVIFPEQPLEKTNTLVESVFRTKMQVAYSPWALQMMDSFSVPETVPSKENVGGGNGGKGPRNGDGGGDDGNGDEGEGEEGEDFLLPGLTLAFAALQIGYCVTTWLKEDGLDPDFTRTALSLLGLLTVSLIRMSCQGGVDAYIIGLSASVGVMIWAAERSVSQRKATPGGIMALFGAAMSFIFTAALYECA